MNLRANVKVCARQPAAPSCPTFLGSINLDEDNDKMNSGKTLERLIGKKVENEKLKKRKLCDDVVSRLSSQLGEIKEQKRRMHDEKKESIRIVSEEWRELMHISLEKQRELICIKEEKNKVDKVKVEDEIMMKDTGNMDPEQKEYICLCRLEILERLKSKFLS